MDRWALIKESLTKEKEELENEISDLELKKAIEQELPNSLQYLTYPKTGLLKVESKQNIQYFFPDTKELFQLADKLSDLMAFLYSNKFNAFRIRKAKDILRKILREYDLNGFKIAKIIDELEFCHKILKFNNSNKYNNEYITNMVKDSINSMIELLKNDYQLIINRIREIITPRIEEYKANPTDYDSTLFVLEKRLSKLRNIDLVFGADSLISFFDSYELLDFFYKWISDKFSEEEQLEIIIDITNFGIHRKDISEENKIDDVVNLNREEVIHEMQQETKQENIDIMNLDLTKFTREEKGILTSIRHTYQDLLEMYGGGVHLSYTDEYHDIDRNDHYFAENKTTIDWPMILDDMEENLFPHVYDDKEFVFKVFKYIVELRKKDKELIRKRNAQIVKISGMIKDYDEILHHVRKYDSRLDYLIEGNHDESAYELEGVTPEYVDLCYFVNHTVQSFIKGLDADHDGLIDQNNKHYFDTEKDKVSLQGITKKHESILGICREKISKYQEKEQGKYIESNDGEVDYDNAKNLVFCSSDIKFDNEFGHFSEDEQKEFRKSVKIMTAFMFSEANFDRLYRKKNGTKSRELDKNNPVKGKYFDSWRCRGLGDSRTGVIHFTRVNLDIKNKLIERYNLDKDCAILVFFDVIATSGANHDPYEDLIKYIDSHFAEFERIGKMFSDPNTNMNELFRIINNGIEIRDNLLKERVY